MNILFPSDPADRHKVEPDFASQLEAAASVGFTTGLISYEDLVYEGSASRAVRQAPQGPCLYRGWMLKPAVYKTLARALGDKGTPMAVTPDAYAYGHHLPEWYADFQSVTATTVWTNSDSLSVALAGLGCLPPGAAIVKDYVKSAKHRWKEACFIPDTRDVSRAREVIAAFIEEQGADLNGGVVLRSFRSYPSSGVDALTGAPVIEERRVFLWRGRPLIITGEEETILCDPLIMNAIKRLRSPFVSVDFARLDDGRWEVVEVGDGQVSGIRDLDPVKFYGALKVAIGEDL